MMIKNRIVPHLDMIAVESYCGVLPYMKGVPGVSTASVIIAINERKKNEKEEISR